jgi:hypothetical protein
MLLRESNFPAFAKKAEKAAMGLGIKFPRAAADLCARVMDDDSEAIGCLLFIVSQIRLAERDLNVAGMLEQQGKQMFLAGTKGSKISARRRKPLLQNAAGIRAISGMFGKGMKGILEKLG